MRILTEEEKGLPRRGELIILFAEITQHPDANSGDAWEDDEEFDDGDS